MMDQILDLNFCGGGGGTSLIGSPMPSHVFKTRICSECGRECTKFTGYKKENVVKFILLENMDGEEKEVEEMTKVYYHNACYKIKEDRHQHKTALGYERVMGDLLEYFHQKELERIRKIEEERRRKEEEERRRLEEEKELLRRMQAEEEEAAAKAAALAELDANDGASSYEEISSSKKESIFNEIVPSQE